jgi:hypothetical protein
VEATEYDRLYRVRVGKTVRTDQTTFGAPGGI